MNAKQSQRVCIYCNDSLPQRSRRDRKFCPEKYGLQNYCKNAFHNQYTLDHYHENKNIKKINILNRDILAMRLGKLETVTVSEAELVKDGFQMGYMINRAIMESSKNEVYLYLRYGLECLGNGVYKIFKHGKQF